MPFCYFPDTVGGTEIYVRELAREQRQRGDEVLVLAPAQTARSYVHEGVRVERFTVSNRITDLRDLYAAGPGTATEFLRVIERFRPDVLHVHGISRAIAPAALREVKRGGAGVVLTYHTPTATCVRGTLLWHGTEPCDGRLDARRCTACMLNRHGLPTAVASMVARAPVTTGSLLASAGLRGKVVTALRTRELVTLRHEQTRELLDTADHIVAPAEWVLALLRRLGVPPGRITLSRQGIRSPARIPTRAPAARPLRLVFVGRLEPAKGIHLVTRALRALPAEPVELDIYGIIQDDAHAQYRTELRAEVDRDGRVRLHDAVSADDVVATIAQHDLLVVPSQQLETGPLVVLEAFAAGLPVLGSRLGGIAELVQDAVNGLLVEPGSVREWSRALERLVREDQLLSRLRAGVRPPRTMTAVADDMAAVYRSIAA